MHTIHEHHGALVQVAQLARFCNAFNIPLLTLLLPSPPAQAPVRGLGAAPAAADGARTLANLLFAYAEAGVPKLTVRTTAAPECAAAAQVGTAACACACRMGGLSALYRGT